MADITTIHDGEVAYTGRALDDPPDGDGVEDQADDADFAELLHELGRKAASGVEPGTAMPPLAAGTFAFYPDGRGGIVAVMDVREGAFPAGTHRGRIGPGLIRTLGLLARGRGRGLRALTRGDRG